jgi:hypothetical protein
MSQNDQYGSPYQGGGYQPEQPYQQPSDPGYGQGYQPGYQTGGGYQDAGYQQTSPYTQSPYGQQSATPSYGQSQSPYGAPVATPWQAQPSTSKKYGIGLLIGLVIATAVICSGVGFFGGRASVDTSSTKTTTTTTGGGGGTTTGGGDNGKAKPVPATSVTPGDGKTLKTYLIKPPAGAHVLKVDDSTDGVQSMDQFLKAYFDNDSNERDLLTQRDYKVCAAADWTTTNDVEVQTQLIQFGAPAGAEDYVTGQKGAFLDDSDVKSHYTIPGVTNGYGFEKPDLDSAGDRRATLMAQDGNIAVVMFIYTPSAFDRTTEMGYMQAQVSALGG